MEHQEITLILMETLLCSDAIFLAGSWHEAQKGNTQQGTLLGRLVLLVKIRRGGIQKTKEPESLLAMFCLESESKQDQWPNSTEPIMAKRNLVTSSDKGSQRKGHKKQHSGLGIPKLLLMLLLMCDFVNWAHYKIVMLSVEAVHNHSLLKTLWSRTSLSSGIIVYASLGQYLVAQMLTCLFK